MMFKLMIKDLKLITSTYYWLFIPVYLVYLFLLKLTTLTFYNGAYVMNAFVMAAALGSIADKMDEEVKAEQLYCSLPLKRSTIINAQYLSVLVLALLSIAFSFLAGVIIRLILGSHNFRIDTSLMGFPEAFYTLFLLLLVSSISDILSLLVPVLFRNKLVFFLNIVTTVIIIFWGLPYLICLFFRNYLITEPFIFYGPGKFLRMTLVIFRYPLPVLIAIVFLVTVIICLRRLRISLYEKRDI